MTDYAGSPIALRNLQTGIRIDGMIVSLSEEEIKVSANKKIFTIMQDNKGRWHDAVNKQSFVMAWFNKAKTWEIFPKYGLQAFISFMLL